METLLLIHHPVQKFILVSKDCILFKYDDPKVLKEYAVHAGAYMYLVYRHTINDDGEHYYFGNCYASEDEARADKWWQHWDALDMCPKRIKMTYENVDDEFVEIVRPRISSDHRELRSLNIRKISVYL